MEYKDLTAPLEITKVPTKREDDKQAAPSSHILIEPSNNKQKLSELCQNSGDLQQTNKHLINLKNNFKTFENYVAFILELA